MMGVWGLRVRLMGVRGLRMMGVWGLRMKLMGV